MNLSHYSKNAEQGIKIFLGGQKTRFKRFFEKIGFLSSKTNSGIGS
jgi:hypothetical protein